MSVTMLHPTGNANVRAVASGLIQQEMLYEFNTSLASFPGSLLDWLGCIKPLAEIRRRRYAACLGAYTKLFPWYELGRLAATKVGLSRLLSHETGIFCIDTVYRKLDLHVASKVRSSSLKGAKAIYAYEDGAYHSFLEAKKNGMKCFYDLPTGYWRVARKIQEAERERWPEWGVTMTGLEDSVSKLSRKDEELRLADCIFVASSFVAKTLQEFDGQMASIEVIPYGFPPVASEREYKSIRNKRPLKVLFVGKLTQQKGIADLFAVAAKFRNHVSLTVVGQKAVYGCRALDARLAKHHWIPSLSHDKVLQLMREHDVLIFPSLFDGFGLVITEAMSQGTPVITTNHTAGPDVIEDGRNGWIVDAGSTYALQEAVENCIVNRRNNIQVGQEAMETAKRRPWEVYQRELIKAIRNHLE